MFKFLRKYNKVMLAVFGVLLMITFLIPQAFDRFSHARGASGATIGLVGDQKVTGAELERARRELKILAAIRQEIPGLGAMKDPEHWYLLVREAQDAGLIGTGESFTVPDESLAGIAAETGERDPRFIRQALENLRGVGRLIDLYFTGGLYSDRRLASAGERPLHQANAQAVI